MQNSCFFTTKCRYTIHSTGALIDLLNRFSILNLTIFPLSIPPFILTKSFKNPILIIRSVFSELPWKICNKMLLTRWNFALRYPNFSGVLQMIKDFLLLKLFQFYKTAIFLNLSFSWLCTRWYVKESFRFGTENINSKLMDGSWNEELRRRTNRVSDIIFRDVWA